ncbi:glycosyltransferase [Candidatus Berkelbacteria bacterium]|nr:glycosyltransferase [Candidatus Berkelbacteria bacterium]
MKLSIIIPAYNEAHTIKHTVAAIAKSANELSEPYELIVVSDGSTDDTAKLARSLHNPKVHVLEYEKNHGKGYALKYGVSYSHGELVTFMDAGGDFDPKHLDLYIKLAELMDADIVIGSKRHPMSQVNYPLHRRAMSWVYHWLVRIMFHLKIHDTQTGFKLFRRAVLVKTLPKLVVKKYAFDLELLVAANRLGFTKITEAPVKMDFNWHKTSLGPRAITKMLIDTLAIFYRTYILRYYDR